MNEDGTRKALFPNSEVVGWPERQQVEAGEMAPGVVEVKTRSGTRVAVRVNAVRRVRDEGELGAILWLDDHGDQIRTFLSYDDALIRLGWLYPQRGDE